MSWCLCSPLLLHCSPLFVVVRAGTLRSVVYLGCLCLSSGFYSYVFQFRVVLLLMLSVAPVELKKRTWDGTIPSLLTDVIAILPFA